MVYEFLNDNITTIALIIVALAFLLRFFSRGDPLPDETDFPEIAPTLRRRRTDDDPLHYDIEKDHFREDERYDFIDDDEF